MVQYDEREGDIGSQERELMLIILLNFLSIVDDKDLFDKLASIDRIIYYTEERYRSKWEGQH